MRNSNVSYEADELQDFLAESFLQEGGSISYIKVGELAALAVHSEEHQPQVYLLFPPESFYSGLHALRPEQKFLVPVFSEEEQQRLLEKLQQFQLENVAPYRLSFFQRYSFYMRQFLRRNRTA